jgi:hypothetical protein
MKGAPPPRAKNKRWTSTSDQAYRNLFLVLVGALLLLLFGIGAETVLFWNPSGGGFDRPRGVMTGLTGALALVVLVLGPLLQAANMRVWTCAWVAAAVLVMVVGVVPTVAYLVLYFG